MSTNTVTRLSAEASLADQDGAVERAREHNGSDPEWDQFVEQVNAGTILPVHFHVSAEAIDAAGDEFTAECVNKDVWLDTPRHLPQLAEDVRVTASKDFGALASQLRERGLDVTADALGDMYVEVTLDDALCDAAARRSSAAVAD